VKKTKKIVKKNSPKIENSRKTQIFREKSQEMSKIGEISKFAKNPQFSYKKLTRSEKNPKFRNSKKPKK